MEIQNILLEIYLNKLFITANFIYVFWLIKITFKINSKLNKLVNYIFLNLYKLKYSLKNMIFYM